MSQLISISNLNKTMGSKQLFDGLSFSVHERERLGLLGPNGAGKSTLLKIIAGVEAPDAGEVSLRKGLRLAFAEQEERFDDTATLLQATTTCLMEAGLDSIEAQVQASSFLGMSGFEDFEQKTSTLSGGWRKRLSLAIALAHEPDLLILDEPTNHLDWDGILWLESLLKSYRQSLILVSHDRAFLNAICNRTMEINSLYKDGFLAFDGGYEQFLKKKDEYTQAQLNLQDTLSNKARREIEWLRAGVKARTTKSKSRAKEAHQLLGELAAVKTRNRAATSKMRVEIDEAGKRSKKLLEINDLTISFDDKCLIKQLNLVLGPRTCVGVLGANGSGKSSVLKAISGVIDTYSGDIIRAEGAQLVYFDQTRESLPQDIDLMEYLGDGSDYTIFKDKSIHVASYASRFLFASDKMKLKIGQLSGGEQARLLIAKLLLKPADILILDEPTNDLDIDSIEVLEDSLLNFPGLIILVSHDRYFLAQLCQKYLALGNNGDWQVYADLEQWLRQSLSNSPESEIYPVKNAPQAPPKSKAKMSYKEKRQLETIEQDIEMAEKELSLAQAELAKPEVFSDSERMQKSVKQLQEKQARVDELYSVWDAIEKKMN